MLFMTEKKKLFNFVLVLIFVASLTLLASGCGNTGDKDYYYRVVTSNDIIIQQGSTSLTTMNFVVRPQEDIEDLYISFSFFDDGNNPIIATSKELGNVNRGGEYNIQLNLLNDKDLTLVQYNKISQYKTDYFRGRIKVGQKTSGVCFYHEFDDGYTTRTATCHITGEKTFTCKNCKYKKTESYASDEHNFILWKVIEESNNGTLGKAWYICKKCAVREQRYI